MRGKNVIGGEKEKEKILRQPSLLFSVLLSSGPFLGDWVPFEIRVLSDLRWAAGI